MAHSKKTYAPEGSTTQEILTGINEGRYYTGSVADLHKLGWESMTVDIDAAEFDIDQRYCIQETVIPERKRGNLSKYAGKNVLVIVSTIAHNGPRINFHIKKS